MQWELKSLKSLMGSWGGEEKRFGDPRECVKWDIWEELKGGSGVECQRTKSRVSISKSYCCKGGAEGEDVVSKRVGGSKEEERQGDCWPVRDRGKAKVVAGGRTTREKKRNAA